MCEFLGVFSFCASELTDFYCYCGLHQETTFMACKTRISISFSSKIMHEIDQVVSFYSNSLCTICPLVRQHHLLFLVGHSHLVNAFDFLHSDIWGPFAFNSRDNHRFSLTIVGAF